MNKGLSSVLEKACRERGLPVTVQRRGIWEALSRHKDHPTADVIYEEVRNRLPGVSRTTVYRVLETIVRLGIAHKVSHPGATVRFDPITERHHHLVCVACDRIEDFNRKVGVQTPKMDSEGFEISDYSIYFRGLCRDCRENRKRRKP